MNVVLGGPLLAVCNVASKAAATANRLRIALGMLSAIAFIVAALPASATLILVQGSVQNPDTGASMPYFDFSAGPSVSDAATTVGGSASSSVSLPTGSMKAVAASPLGAVDVNGNPIISWTAGAFASLDETLHVAGGIAGTLTGYLVVAIDGTLTPSVAEGSAPSAYAILDTVVVTSLGTEVRKDEARTTACPVGGPAICASGSVFNINFLVPFLISDLVRDIEIEIGLTVSAQGGALANFGNSVGLGIQLPTGLSFTSDSGAFLTEVVTPPSDIPEPTTISLLALGLLLLGIGTMPGAGPMRARNRRGHGPAHRQRSSAAVVSG